MNLVIATYRTVLLQGSVLEEAAAFLVERLRIPKKFIDVK